MPLAIRIDQPAQTRGLAIWRVLVWLVLLVAAFGCLQYLNHAQLVWGQLRASTNAQDTGVLRGMLGWDIAYLLAAFALIVICAGCILRQAWARPCMRIAALLLALLLLISGWVQLRELQEFDLNGAILLSHVQASGVAALAQAIAKLHRSYQLALWFRAIAVPLLLWLAWRLGQPVVRMQFRLRR